MQATLQPLLRPPPPLGVCSRSVEDGAVNVGSGTFDKVVRGLGKLVCEGEVDLDLEELAGGFPEKLFIPHGLESTLISKTRQLGAGAGV
jgi:hypothetical protein